MKQIEAPCPACGAPVVFRVSSSLVSVCEYCHSLVARGDRRLEDLGKVAAIIETNSPLELGKTGRYRDKPFEIVGRVQYRHAAGGTWDEWYASFPGNRWGWLAEAQGRFYMTFRVKRSQQIELPASDSLEVGQSIDVPSFGTLVVHERGTATLIAAEGELPYRPDPGAPHPFADLSGDDRRFGTIDYSDTPPTLYLGAQVTLDEIGIAPPEEPATKEVGAHQLACPSCGGGLDLKAPDQAERVTCPFCDALLDVNQGNLVYLKTLARKKVEPVIPLGSVGVVRGKQVTVIGFLRRSVNYEGRDYYWTEYLLYDPREGFFWLVCSDSHWSFVEPVPLGEVVKRGSNLICRGHTFKLYSRAMARVRDVYGEFYWKVEVGETVEVEDYIAPPHMLSVETTGITVTDREVNVSFATYVPAEEIEKAFDLPSLPRGWGVAPHQPNPTDKNIYWTWLGLVAMLVGLYAGFAWTRPSGSFDPSFFWIALVFVSLVPLGTWLYSHDFEKRRWADSDYSPYATDDD